VNHSLKQVLFVCIGNACRSQMAEAFARSYGSDVIVPASAGISPAHGIPPDTLEAMAEKGLDLKDHFPKHVEHLGRIRFDLVVNMSGMELPVDFKTEVRTWDIEDPVWLSYEKHCGIRDQLERRVMDLIIELRRDRNKPQLRGIGSGRV
jgi:arsenate reductase